MKYLWISSSIFFLTSCILEDSTTSSTEIINNTSDRVRVIAYSNDTIDQRNTFKIMPNKSETILAPQLGGGLGEGVTFGETAMFTFGIDSFVVQFDKKYILTHYKSDSMVVDSVGCSFKSKRNIFNRSSYKQILSDKSKHFREWKFEYTFTEQDYQDAKERGRKVK